MAELETVPAPGTNIRLDQRHRQLWDARFDELGAVVEELKRKEKVDGRKKGE